MRHRSRATGHAVRNMLPSPGLRGHLDASGVWALSLDEGGEAPKQ